MRKALTIGVATLTLTLTALLPAHAADVRYSKDHAISAQCRAMADQAQDVDGADRILCDCETGAELCMTWDSTGQVISIIRPEDISTGE